MLDKRWKKDKFKLEQRKSEDEVKLERYCQTCKDYTEHKSLLRSTWERIICTVCGTGSEYRTG